MPLVEAVFFRTVEHYAKRVEFHGSHVRDAALTGPERRRKEAIIIRVATVELYARRQSLKAGVSDQSEH